MLAANLARNIKRTDMERNLFEHVKLVSRYRRWFVDRSTQLIPIFSGALSVSICALVFSPSFLYWTLPFEHEEGFSETPCFSKNIHSRPQAHVLVLNPKCDSDPSRWFVSSNEMRRKSKIPSAKKFTTHFAHQSKSESKSSAKKPTF